MEATSHYGKETTYPCGFYAGQIVVLDGKALVEVYHQFGCASRVAVQSVGASGKGMKREVDPKRLALPTEAQLRSLEARLWEKQCRRVEKENGIMARLRDTEVLRGD